MADRKPLGRLPSPPDARDYGLRSLLPGIEGVVELPSSFSISTCLYMGRFDQQENSCVGHSIAFALITQERRGNLGRYYPIEPLWIWDRSKERDGIGSPTSDRGTYIRTGLDVVRDMGATLSRTDKSAESTYRVESYARCTTAYQVKLALYQSRGPVVFGSTWFDSWFSPSTTTGMLPMPDNEAGGHAFVGIGWSNGIICPDGSKGAFKCVNSWSERWGKRGDFYLPYSMFGDGKPADEAWAIKAMPSVL